MEWLRHIDVSLLFAINHSGSREFDPFMQLISDRNFWWGVGGLVTLLVAIKRNSRLWATWGLILFTVGISDAFTYYVLKEYFQRLRPCVSVPGLRMIQNCAGGFGFPSNHAASGMAIAVVTALAFRSKWKWGVLVGTVLVGLSRVYLGVHFPGDVLAGFFEGAILGAGLFYALDHLTKHFLSTPPVSS